MKKVYMLFMTFVLPFLFVQAEKYEELSVSHAFQLLHKYASQNIDSASMKDSNFLAEVRSKLVGLDNDLTEKIKTICSKKLLPHIAKFVLQKDHSSQSIEILGNNFFETRRAISNQIEEQKKGSSKEEDDAKKRLIFILSGFEDILFDGHFIPKKSILKKLNSPWVKILIPITLLASYMITMGAITSYKHNNNEQNISSVSERNILPTQTNSDIDETRIEQHYQEEDLPEPLSRISCILENDTRENNKVFRYQDHEFSISESIIEKFPYLGAQLNHNFKESKSKNIVFPFPVSKEFFQCILKLIRFQKIFENEIDNVEEDKLIKEISKLVPYEFRLNHMKEYNDTEKVWLEFLAMLATLDAINLPIIMKAIIKKSIDRYSSLNLTLIGYLAKNLPSGIDRGNGKIQLISQNLKDALLEAVENEKNR